MAGLAGQTLVRPQQGKAGGGDMIELRLCPVDGAVTTLTPDTVATRVHVIVHMTAIAVAGNPVKDLVLMTAAACHRPMASGERECRGVVIENRIFPVVFVVTVATGARHLSLMNILMTVTARARGWRRRPLGVDLMTVGTQRHRMHPAEREIGP